MKALSIRQPWAWLIVRPDLTDPEARAEAVHKKLIKDTENRTWWTPDYCAEIIGRVLDRSIDEVHRKARSLGLKKSLDWIASTARERTSSPTHGSTRSRFQKGNRPWTHGRKGYQAGGRNPETQFKAGMQPHNWQPIGHEVVRGDGYLSRKVSDERGRHSRFSGTTTRASSRARFARWASSSARSRLLDPDNPMDIARAGAVSDVAQTIINSAKVEVDLLRVTGAEPASSFFGESLELPRPRPRLVGRS